MRIWKQNYYLSPGGGCQGGEGGQSICGEHVGLSGNGGGISRRQQSIEIELLKIDSELTFKEGDSCKYENDYLSPRGWGGGGGDNRRELHGGQ